MGRRKQLDVPLDQTELIRVSADAQGMCKKLAGMRGTSIGKEADKLIKKYGPGELAKAMKEELKKMGKQ